MLVDRPSEDEDNSSRSPEILSGQDKEGNKGFWLEMIVRADGAEVMNTAVRALIAQRALSDSDSIVAKYKAKNREFEQPIDAADKYGLRTIAGRVKGFEPVNATERPLLQNLKNFSGAHEVVRVCQHRVNSDTTCSPVKKHFYRHIETLAHELEELENTSKVTSDFSVKILLEYGKLLYMGTYSNELIWGEKDVREAEEQPPKK